MYNTGLMFYCHFQKTDNFSVFDIVAEMRKQRIAMVQTKVNTDELVWHIWGKGKEMRTAMGKEKVKRIEEEE